MRVAMALRFQADELSASKAPASHRPMMLRSLLRSVNILLRTTFPYAERALFVAHVL